MSNRIILGVAGGSGSGKTTVVDQYMQTVRPMHQAFVEGSRAFADILIPEGGRNQVAIDLLVSRLRTAVA